MALEYPARVSNPVPPIKSRVHRRNACGAGNRIRLPAACLLIAVSSLWAGRELNPLRTPYKDAALTVELPASVGALATAGLNRAVPAYQTGLVTG